MRVMVIVKATPNSEAGAPPTPELLQAMGDYNEQLVKAGIMQAGEGLHPSAKGKRMHFTGGRRLILDGPFIETKELIAGYWLWNVKSMDEAMQWLEKCPDPMPGEESIIEVRPIMEAEDFGEEFTEAMRAQEERLRAEMAARQGG
ncbi:MAG: YciI family protein [Myxococcales bacterium]|nr:YciI family protein [Myxococcales bacterium]